MSQNDLSIANQGFASFRSDLNSALQALGSTNSGTSAPSTTYANQLFYDTTNNILKIRNEDNDAFISLFTLDQTNDNIESLTVDGILTVATSVKTPLIEFTDGDDALTITDGGNVAVGGTLTANAGVIVDNITIDGTEIDLSSGDLTIDVAGDISLDADGGNIKLLDGGTQFADIYLSSNSFHIYNPISDGDIILQGNDGGSAITALTLDMSDAGKATFNNAILVADGTSSLPSFGFSGDSNTGLFRAGGDAIGFSTGGSERARVDNNGTLLIGKTTPANSAGAGDIQGAGAGAVNYELRSDSAGIQFGVTSNHYLALRTNNSERVRIDNSGNVGIGTATPASFNVHADNLVVGTTSGENGITIVTGTSNSARFVFSDNSTSSNDAFVGAIEYSHSSNEMIFYNSGTQRMKIETNGDVKNSTGTYGTISDENLKENISDASSQWEDIKALQVRKYSMKTDNLDSADKIGVIAQELEKSGMNGLVEETEWTDPDDILKKDKIKTVKYSILYMKAIKALQEAMARIETLEAKVTALESK